MIMIFGKKHLNLIGGIFLYALSAQAVVPCTRV